MQGLTGDAPPAAAPVQTAPVVAPRRYDEAKIQVRLTNGKTLVQVILEFRLNNLQDQAKFPVYVLFADRRGTV